MIILDTNVISASMRRGPEPLVRDWLDRQPGETAWTTSVTVLEVRTGLESLDPGDRRVALEGAFDALLRSDLEERILAFDVAAANVVGAIAGAQRARRGRPSPTLRRSRWSAIRCGPRGGRNVQRWPGSVTMPLAIPTGWFDRPGPGLP